MAGMPGSTGPLIPRRRLGAEFRRLREARGEQLKDTAKALMFSTSKLSRIETGVSEPTARDLRDLLTYFELAGTEPGAELERWAKEAAAKPWWSLAGFVMPRQLDTYIQHESPADIIEEYSSTFVCGLLQTAAYSAAVFRGLLPGLPDDQVRHQVELRQARRRFLDTRSQPPRMVCAIPEDALSRLVGSRSTMQDQLRSLIRDSENPRIALHVVPLSAGVYPALDGSFTIFTYSREPDVSLLVLSSSFALRAEDGKKVLADYRSRFDALQSVWLDQEDSRSLIEELLAAPR
jgi:transcriptional regulator with XRE-family HTH domain